VARATVEVTDVFRRYGETYRRTHRLPRHALRLMRAIEICRTATLGGHVGECGHCGHRQISYNSCRNRHCPGFRFQVFSLGLLVFGSVFSFSSRFRVFSFWGLSRTDPFLSGRIGLMQVTAIGIMRHRRHAAHEVQRPPAATGRRALGFGIRMLLAAVVLLLFEAHEPRRGKP
jgi:hypothetical protein